MLNANDMIEWFRSSPEGQAIVATRETEHFATRDQLAADLASAKTDLAKQLVAAEKMLNKAVAKYREAEQALRETNAEVQRLASERNNLGFRGDRKIADIERELLASADNELIDQFVAAARGEITELSRESSIQHVYQSKDDRFGNPIQRRVETNLFSLRRRIASIATACQAAEQLRLSATRDIRGELAKLRESLPAVRLEPTGV